MSEHRPVPVPEPLAPGGAPPDRYCDLVLTGGVASGVVYPWALLELARAFRALLLGHALWLYLKLAVLLPLAAGWIVVWLSGDGWAAAGAAAIAALALLLVAMLRFYRDLAVHMVKNQHGVCKGLERRVAASERAAGGRTRRNG